MRRRAGTALPRLPRGPLQGLLLMALVFVLALVVPSPSVPFRSFPFCPAPCESAGVLLEWPGSAR